MIQSLTPPWKCGAGNLEFPGGNTYRLQTAASPDQVPSGRRESAALPHNLTNFYVAVDVVNWGRNGSQVFGVLARVSNVGPGQTMGYLFSWDNGTHLSTTGDMTSFGLTVNADGPGRPDYFGNDPIHLVL